MSTPEKQIKTDNNGYATKVVISLVKSPFYNELESKVFDTELKAHFSSLKTYKLNDYILLQSQLNPGMFSKDQIAQVNRTYS